MKNLNFYLLYSLLYLSSCNIVTNSEQILNLQSKSEFDSTSTVTEAPLSMDQPIVPTKISCTNSTQDPLSNIQRLTKRELTNSIVAILNEIDSSLVTDSKLNSLINAIPNDIINGKENSLLLSQQIVNAHFDLFYRVGELVASSTNAQNYLVGNNGCLSQSSISTTCQNTFIKNLGRIVFRRNLETMEINYLVSLFSDGNLVSNSDKIKAAVTSALSSPDHLYQIYDKGSPHLTKINSNTLNALEFATKLSFFLVGAPPDSTLKTLANNGTIFEKEVLKIQISRLLKTKNGQNAILRFYREWLHYDIFDNLSYPADFLNGISTTNLQNAMIREIEEYLLYITLNNVTMTYKDLMTSNHSFIYDDSLAQVYGINNPNGLTLLNSKERAGLMTRAAFLTKRSGVLTSPIKRGIEIKNYLLCEGVGAPPPNAPTNIDPLPEGVILSTRDRIAAITEKAGTSCTICHTQINPLGYPFEIYDSIGRYRTQEKIFNADGTATGKFAAINSQSTTNQLDSKNITISDAVSLSNELGSSKKALACMAIRWNEFVLKRQAKNVDSCQIDLSYKHLAGTSEKQGSLYDMIVHTIMSDSFKNWNY
jgi:Protein of unknown function (DUF1592)/Protein of unknown function (DUF1588)